MLRIYIISRTNLRDSLNHYMVLIDSYMGRNEATNPPIVDTSHTRQPP